MLDTWRSGIRAKSHGGESLGQLLEAARARGAEAASGDPQALRELVIVRRRPLGERGKEQVPAARGDRGKPTLHEEPCLLRLGQFIRALGRAAEFLREFTGRGST